MKTFRVFVDKEGKFGNPVGITVDIEGELSADERQRITKESGFSECVFIDDLENRSVSIYNPQREVKFAGHALVGTAYFLEKLLGGEVRRIVCKAGVVKARVEGDKTWINASLEGTPPWKFKELDEPEEVDDLTLGQKKDFEHTVFWAWVSKEENIVRARTFAPDWGIPEDEANGSGSMQLSVNLGRRLEIRHGKGSVIYSKPLNENMSEVGGRVLEDYE